MRFGRRLATAVVFLYSAIVLGTAALAGECDFCVCTSDDTDNSCKKCCSSAKLAEKTATKLELRLSADGKSLVDQNGEVLARFAAAVAGHAREQIAAGVDALNVSAPWAGQNFVSPKLHRELLAPAQAVLVAAARAGGVPSYCHTCGAIGDRLEAIIDTGFDGIECLDPPPLGNVELADAVWRIGQRAFIKGNIDPVHVLLRGTPAQIRADVIERLEIGMTARGFILSTACSISPETPAAHVVLLRELVERYGVY